MCAAVLYAEEELASQEEFTSQKELASQEELASASVLSSPDLVGRIVDMGRHGTPFFGCDAPLIDVRSAGALRLVDSVWRAAVEERLRAAAAVEISCRLPPALSTPAANHVLLRFEHAAAPATVSRALASFLDGHDLASLAVRGLNLRRFMTSLLAVLKRRGGGGLCSLDLAGCLAVPTMVVGSRPAPACLFSQHRLVPALLGACPGLRALDLSGLHLPPEALQSLSRAPMSALRLHGCTLERGSVLTLLRPGSALAASLTFLDLGGCSLSASDAEEALELVQLRSLCLSDARLCARAFGRRLARLSRLRELDLSETELLPSGCTAGVGVAPCDDSAGEAAASLLLDGVAAMPALRRLSLRCCAWLTRDGLRRISRVDRQLALSHDLLPPKPAAARAGRSSPPPDSWEELDGDAALPVLRESRGGPASKRRTVGGASAAADSVMYVGNSVVQRPLSIYHVSQGDEPLFGNARPRRSAFADGCGLLRS